MCTDDVVFLSPNEPVLIGKAAVRAWSAAYLNAYRIHWDKTVKGFDVAGDWAIERYSYKQNDRARHGAASVTDTGKGSSCITTMPTESGGLPGTHGTRICRCLAK